MASVGLDSAGKFALVHFWSPEPELDVAGVGRELLRGSVHGGNEEVWGGGARERPSSGWNVVEEGER